MPSAPSARPPRSRRLGIVAIPLGITLLAFLFGLQIARGTVYYDRFIQDIPIHLNGIAYLQAGLWPHRDFGTPVGVGYYLLFYATTALTAPGAFTAVYANGLAAGIVILLCLAANWKRLNGGWLALLTFYLGLVALSPRHFGAFAVTFNAAYNRWSWALFGILIVVIALERRSSTNESGRNSTKPKIGAAIGDALLAALLLTLLFYLKVTFAAVGAGLVGVAALTIRRNSNPLVFLAVAGGVSLLMVAAIGLGSGILLPYISDLISAAQAQQGRGSQAVLLGLVLSSDFLLAILVAAGASTTVPDRRRLIAPAIFLLALLGAAFVLAVQNNFAFEIPLVPIVAMLAWLLFAPQADLHSDHAPRTKSIASAVRDPRHWLVLAVIAWLFFRPVLLDVRALLWESFAPVPQSDRIAWLSETALRDLRVGPGADPVAETGQCRTGGATLEMGNDREYLSVFHDAVDLLHRNGGRPGAHVLSLTWTNPFPALAGTAVNPHELSWWDPVRSFSVRHHPAAGTVLHDVDYVLEPRFRWEYFAQTTDLMTNIYGRAIAHDFSPIATTGCWRLWKRKPMR